MLAANRENCRDDIQKGWKRYFCWREGYYRKGSLGGTVPLSADSRSRTLGSCLGCKMKRLIKIGLVTVAKANTLSK